MQSVLFWGNLLPRRQVEKAAIASLKLGWVETLLERGLPVAREGAELVLDIWLNPD